MGLSSSATSLDASAQPDHPDTTFQVELEQ